MERKSLKNKKFFEIITPKGNTLWLVYNNSHTIGKIIETLENNFESSDDDIYYNSEKLERYFVEEDFSATPSELKLDKKETIVLTIGAPKYYKSSIEKKYEEISNKSSTMQIYYKRVCDYTKSLNVSSKHTIEEVNYMIYNKEGILPCDQRLIYNGHQLDIDKTLADYDIKEGNVLHLILRWRGGMYSETSGKAGNYGELKNCVIFVE